MLRKGDILLVIFILLAVATGMAGMRIYNSYTEKSLVKVAVIKQGDKIVKRINLGKIEKPYKVNLNGDYENTMLVEKGKIRYQYANCPDKVCVKTGWLTKNGDAAFCLPNRTMIKIEGEKASVDEITY